MHGNTVGHVIEDQKRGNYKIVTKTRHTITRAKKYVMVTPVSVEDYLRKEMPKAKRTQTNDNLNELCSAGLA